MISFDRLTDNIPSFAKRKLIASINAILPTENSNPKVIFKMLPSIFKSFVLQEAKKGKPVLVPASHKANFDFSYGGEFPEMYELYRRAVQNQWDGDKDLDWRIDVDPFNDEKFLLPENFCPFDQFEKHKVYLTKKQKQEFKHCATSWMMSQFLHGEQGALFAAAQITEAIPWFDGKFYGSTQVVDEGRHIEVFLRYIDTKLNKLYQINDNLFVILDQLMTDSRWDMKFLGMQIMVEGLALGAFSNLHFHTREPLLKDLLRYVIQDEARHVHYGVLALKEFIDKELNEKERKEREDWAFEIAILMRDRFLMHEVYEEWFGGTSMSKKTWNECFSNTLGMTDFRQSMFKRLIPNLKYIGLLSPRIEEKYKKEGLYVYSFGKNASEISSVELLS